MNLVDLLLILVFLLALWTGWQKGFILGTVNLFVWLGSLLAGFLAYRPIGNLLLDIFPGLGVWTQPLSFFVAIAVARLVLALICNPLMNRTSIDAHERPVNHALGLIPGAVNGFVYAVIFAALLLSTPISNSITDATKKSMIAGRLSHEVAWLDEKLSPIFYPALRKTMAGLTVEPGADETVILHFKVKDASVQPDLEAEMLQLVNQERIKRGIAPLQADTALAAVARDHSRDMFEEGYFSHYTLSGKDPFERMHEHGVHFTTAGENLALGQTLSICHDGLMNSPGHRANILNPAFGRVGIGILDGGFHGLMISQDFRN